MLDNPMETDGNCEACPDEAEVPAVVEVANVRLCLSHVCSTYGMNAEEVIRWLRTVGIHITLPTPQEA